MKKLLLISLSLFALPVALYAVDADVTLTPNFLKYDGTYKFELDVEGKAIHKAWGVTIKNGKATLEHVKGIKGKNIEMKGNVISAKIGILKKKKAKDLEIQALDGVFQGQYVTMTPRKDTTKFTIDIGPGLTLNYVELTKAKMREHFAYRLQIGANLPDGSYTCDLLRHAEKHKKFVFDVKDHKVIKVSGDKEGKLADGLLQIEATIMCANRRAIEGVAIGFFGAAALLGTIVSGGAMWAVAAAPASIVAAGGAETAAFYIGLQLGLTSAEASTVAIQTGSIAEAATTAAVVAAMPAAIAATVGADAGITADKIKKTAEAIEQGKTFGGSVMGAMFGFRECTLQITCNSGTFAGKAVKIDYEECRKNIWVLNSTDKKILVSGK